MTNQLPPETRVNGFDNQADFLIVTGAAFEQYAAAAETLAAGADVERLAPCAPDSQEACADRFIRAFGRRAYGRPLDEPEVRSFVSLFGKGRDGGTYQDGIRLVIEALLQSPFFLYATELGPGQPAARALITLTEHELASQLSFLITGSRPDELLLAAAERGVLKDPAQRGAQAVRLMADPRARPQLRQMVFGWLELPAIATLAKDPRLFPELTDGVRAAMIEEATSFVDGLLWGEAGSFADLLTAWSPSESPALRSLYAADPPGRRRGLLSLPLFLTVHSAAEHSSPVGRGVFVRQRIFCQALPMPPANALARPIDFGDHTTTTRQKYAQHSSDPACRGCHDLIDPIGFGLEEMDPIGRFRTMEAGLPVDSSGMLTGTDVDGTFTGPAELAQRLASSEMVSACFSTQLFRFAEGRPETAADECEIARLTQQSRHKGARVRDLLVAFVQRPSFTTRRSEP